LDRAQKKARPANCGPGHWATRATSGCRSAAAFPRGRDGSAGRRPGTGTRPRSGAMGERVVWAGARATRASRRAGRRSEGRGRSRGRGRTGGRSGGANLLGDLGQGEPGRLLPTSPPTWSVPGGRANKNPEKLGETVGNGVRGCSSS